MDLVDLIEEKSFLGQDFLTWLWFKSEERGGSINVPAEGMDIQISFEKHMLLEYGEGESHEKVICRGLQTELQEARTGLVMGKKLEQARIRLGRGDYEWLLTIGATLMEFRSVKPPKTEDSVDDRDNPDSIAGRVLDRIGMMETALRTIDELYRMFLAVRTGPEWEKELARLRAWVHRSGAA